MDDKKIQPLELIWGAANIGRELNLDTRQAFYALERGSIPAKKVGGKWVAERGKLRDFFTGQEGQAN